MKKVERTSSFDSADRDVIMAAGGGSQTDCAAFIEEQKQILNEFERLKGSALTHGHVTRESNDKRTHMAGLRRAWKICKLHCEQQGLKVSSRVKNHHFSKFAIFR